MKGTLAFLWETAKVVLIALVIVLPLRAWVFQPFLVSGDSMEPNFHSGDYLLVDEISYAFHDPARGDVIILKYPNNLSQRFIKRIVGLPGETVEIRNGNVLIEGPKDTIVLNESAYLSSSAAETPGNEKMTLGQGEYFVLGDNRRFSLDSRIWGVLPRKDIVGKIFARVASLKAFVRAAQ